MIGALAVPLWATWPLLATLTTSAMPLFQYLAVIFGSGAVALFLLPGRPEEPRHGTASRGSSSKFVAAIMVGFGLFVSNLLFMQAIRHISVAQANLILYLWPVMVVALCVPLRLVAPRLTHLAGIAMGLCGAALVIGGGNAALSWAGVGLAATGGLIWAVYVVYRAWQGEGAPEALAWGLGLSALVALVLHLALEDSVVPSMAVLSGSILVGIFPLALGNLLWDHGVRKGDRLVLATLAYATPLVGSLILIAFGYAVATPGLMVGAVLIVAAGIVASR